LLVRRIVAAVEPRHALGATLVEGGGERLFGSRLACAFAWKDRDPRDPPYRELVAPALTRASAISAAAMTCFA
jgi:hypothetical protein